MTNAERNLWNMARAAVVSGKIDEGYWDLQERGADLKTLQLYLLYVQLNRSVENGRSKSN